MNWFKNIFQKKPKVIVICGPTATGKTSLSIDIARHYNGEVISADSRQIYRGLDVGSAKVTEEEMNGIPHHMIDVVDPNDRYSVQQFVSLAQTKIKEILARGNTPIICGGTGQYIDALVFNQTFPEVPPNVELRKILESKSTDTLFKQLQKKDPRRAESIDRHNKVRLVRALEIVHAIGNVPKQKQKSPYNALFIGLDINKEELNQRIKKRIIDRFENQEMLEEAIKLHTNSLSYERMEELGLEYRFMGRHLQGKISRNEMIEELNIATRQFAKRQRTWFRRNKNIHWFHPVNDQMAIEKLVEKFLKLS